MTPPGPSKREWMSAIGNIAARYSSLRAAIDAAMSPATPEDTP